MQNAKESAKKDEKSSKNEQSYHFFTEITDFL
ncbi:hypothetical protein UNH65_32510 [Chitinophaga sp. 180180018-2]|jgi:hypothetical protein|nr:hypothetical protein [Chitinophaga sp. 212800010-3]